MVWVDRTKGYSPVADERKGVSNAPKGLEKVYFQGSTTNFLPARLTFPVGNVKGREIM
jgi:hypothetical protein